jgi:hypothetical protein
MLARRARRPAHRRRAHPGPEGQAFAEKLRAVGVVYRLKIFPTAPHGIPIAEQWREVEPFLEQYLR